MKRIFPVTNRLGRGNKVLVYLLVSIYFGELKSLFFIVLVTKCDACLRTIFHPNKSDRMLTPSSVNWPSR